MGYSALFNTMVNTTESVIGSDRTITRDEFDKTMNMPTYLIAFVISDYDIDSASLVTPKDNTLIRLPAPKHFIDNLTQYGLESSARIIDGLSDYFDFAYSNSFIPGRAKSDQIGVWGMNGAMENVSIRTPA